MPFLNPKLGIDFSNYIADRTLNFTERGWVFEAIQSWLADPKGDRFFLLTGEPGSGKTAIAARLTQFAQGVETYPGLAEGFLQAVHFCSARDSVWIDPKEFARSLALQLAASIPEFALALKDIGEKTNNINVDLTVGTAQNSNIQGVVIQNLTLSGLTGQEAFTQVVVNPLRQIQQEGFSQPVTILVDSLDEALTHDGESTIVGLLSKLSADVKLRLVLTSRNEGRVKDKLNEYNDYEELFLSASEHLEKNQQDVRAYIDAKFNQEEALQSSLQAEVLDQAVLKTSLIEKSEGNFLYVRFLLESVALGQQSFASLDGFPQGLDELYYSSLGRVVELGKKDWSEVYAPVMGVLLAAQESLTASQIRAFTKLKESVVWDCLIDLQQFLDEIEAEDEETQYKLYHQSVTDFLGKRQLVIRKKKSNSRYYLPGQEQHQRLLEYYRPEGKTWSDVQIEKIDAYGRQHLAQHLVKGDRVEELHTLLNLEKDGKNAWFMVKDDEGDTAGFLADVELAWSQVDEAYNHERGKSIGLQCRYALIKASINSLAKIPVSLMVALVKHGDWEPAKALAQIRQIPYPAKRFQSLLALAEPLETGLLKDQVLQLALQAAQDIPDQSSRTWALGELVDKLPPEFLPQEALEAAQATKNESACDNTLVVETDKLPKDQVSEDIQAIQKENYCTEVSKALTDELTSETLIQALEAVQAIQDEFDRAEALTALVAPIDKLAPKKLPQLLEVARAIQDQSSCAWALKALADELAPKTLSQALEDAQAIQDEKYRAKALRALADSLTSEAQPQAIEAAQAIKQPFYRAQALMALADKQPDAWLKTLEAAQAIQNEVHRVWVLMALVDQRPELRSQALEAVQAIQNNFDRTQELRSIAVKLPERLPQALEAAQAIQHEYYRAKALMALTDQLTPETLPQALEAAQATESEYYRAPALTALVSHLINDSDRFSLWKGSLHFLAYRTRPDLLSDMAALAPVIFALSGDEPIEAMEAIQDVARWWP